nr:reverse transcriptase domain-containing protein [Tanacetum cinerariifolium]
MWLKKEPPRSILTWEDLVSKFINQFFPPSKTTNLRNEITNFQQRFDESFYEARDHFKDLLRACPHHGFTELHQLDTFYNAINPTDQDSLNSAAGVALTDAVKDLLRQNETQTPVTVKVVEETCNTASTSGSRPLPSNTIANPRGDLKAITTQSGVSYDGPPIPSPFSSLPKVVEWVPEPKPTIPYPSRVNKQKLCEKDDHLALKFVEIFKKLHFNLRFADALLHMPKFAIMFKSILNNKEKLFNLATTMVNENCSAVILKRLPGKVRDPGKFFIPCDFPEFVECLALADLGASINLMPLSIWKKLSLPELTPTRMILELADRLKTRPAGIAEDIFVKVGKFHFPTDFVVVDYAVDPRVPLILGRPFLRTGRALIDVYGEELTLRVDDEAITFKVYQTLKYSYNDAESINQIDVIDVASEEYVQEVLVFSDNSKSGNPTLISDPIIALSSLSLTPFEGGDFILEEIEACPTSKTIPLGIDDTDFDLEGDIHLLEKLLNDDPSSSPLPLVKNEDLKQVDATMTKPLIEEPSELKLKDLPFIWNMLLSKIIVYMDHSALKYLLAKQDAKPRLLRWILLLQEFDVIIRDKKGAKNLAADHLSRLENPHQDELEKKKITETYPLEALGMIAFRGDSSTSWFANIVNYRAGNFIVKGMSSQ